MKRNVMNGKRFMGTTLVALTMMAGMSATAFAGEPQMMELKAVEMKAAVQMEKVGSEDLKLMDLTSVPSTDVTTIDMNVDVSAQTDVNFKEKEEDGVTYWSFDGGENWNETTVITLENGEKCYAIQATPTTPATINEDSKVNFTELKITEKVPTTKIEL